MVYGIILLLCDLRSLFNSLCCLAMLCFRHSYPVPMFFLFVTITLLFYSATTMEFGSTNRGGGVLANVQTVTRVS